MNRQALSAASGRRLADADVTAPRRGDVRLRGRRSPGARDLAKRSGNGRVTGVNILDMLQYTVINIQIDVIITR